MVINLSNHFKKLQYPQRKQFVFCIPKIVVIFSECQNKGCAEDNIISISYF